MQMLRAASIHFAHKNYVVLKSSLLQGEMPDSFDKLRINFSGMTVKKADKLKIGLQL